MKKVIINATVLTMNSKSDIMQNAYIRTDGKYICEIGHMTNYRADNEEVIDADGSIVMPGFINLHTHLSMIPFRGLGDDTADRLRRFLIPMEKRWMDKELVHLAAKYAIAEELLAGITTVVDMYYFEEEVMRAAREMGIRGFFGETLMDEPTPSFSTPQKALQYTKDTLLALSTDKVKVCIAPHATYSCSLKTLLQAKSFAKENNLLFTTHVAEMDYEMKLFQEKHHLSPIAFLAKNGLLDEKSLLAHCIHMNKEDIALLSQTQARMAHCIGANTKSAKGIAPLTSVFHQKIPVGLGTDGPSSGNTLDMFTQMKMVANFHKYITGDRQVWPCRDILHLTTLGAARVLHLDQEIGSLEIGKKADLIIIETESVNMFPIYEPSSALVYSANANNVRDVMIAGEFLVKNKNLVNFSLSELKKNLLEKMKQTEFQPLSKKTH